MTEKTLRCMDCGLPYGEFGLDTTIPDDQWHQLVGRPGGVLCANCIVKRAAKLPNAIALRAHIEIDEEDVAVELARVQAAKDALEKRNHEWLIANGPGGWINDLRAAKDAADAQCAEWKAVATDFHNALVGHMMAGAFNHSLCDKAVEAFDRLIAADRLAPPQKDRLT